MGRHGWAHLFSPHLAVKGADTALLSVAAMEDWGTTRPGSSREHQVPEGGEGGAAGAPPEEGGARAQAAPSRTPSGGAADGGAPEGGGAATARR